ncbi:hypothetical protein ACA910_020130 [Epithemia clementina (nom. ined.)]
MNRILHVDHANLQVTFQAYHAIRILHENYGLALVNMGSSDRQTLGGAIAGGTHGTSGSDRSDTFTSSIVELKMVTAQGGDILLEPDELTTYGVGGIIYQVTLKVVPFYYLRQITTTMDSSLIDFEQWWDFDYGFFMARWMSPNLPDTASCCQLIQFEKATVEQYLEDRQIARRERCNRIFTIGALPFAPKWYRRRRVLNLLCQESNFVDVYIHQFANDPYPHYLEWEYAVPFDNNPNALVPQIPGAVEHIPYPVEVLMRISPKDAAIGHLAHEHDVVWFSLNIVIPSYVDCLSQDEMNCLAEPFERLMTDSGSLPVVAYPHKLMVHPDWAGLTQDHVDFLSSFQYTHDPKGKMFNDCLAELFRERKPKHIIS